MSTKVCVTGAAGYVGSSLVSKLLLKGYTVHATLRNLGDESKVGFLKSLPGADTRLHLFEADLYNAEDFDPAIEGCQFVFLVATPQQHYAFNSKYKDISEAAVSAVHCILESCRQSGSVKRVIYTGSVTASSPLKEDGTGYKDFLDESCWTPLISFDHCEAFAKHYTFSKTLSEKELLSYDDNQENKGMEVVSLACGLIGGDPLLLNAPLSVQVIASPLTGDTLCYKQLKFLQSLLGSIPLVHIEDVCNAHIFCMKKPSLSGRFLCASDYPMMQQFVDYCEQEYPKLIVTKEVVGDVKGINCSSRRLIDAGFQYGFGLKHILDDSIKCVNRCGGLKKSL